MKRLALAVLSLLVLSACSGSAGSQGPQGERGEAGLQGVSGPTGPTGPQGEVGPQGATGAPGGVGAVGAQGPAGSQGAVGPQGATGPQGIAGSQGIEGPPGPAGPGMAWRGAWDVATAYVIHDAVEHEGSSYVAVADGIASAPPSPDWSLLASIGATGAPGPQGVEGPQGLAGADGATGPEGPTGPQGDPGVPGPIGPVGPAGPPGAAGADGQSVTSQALPAGDSSCAAGGSAFTSSSGTTYACNGAPARGATYRLAVFETYDQMAGWLLGNNPLLFGGVNPSSWTDGNATASQMSGDKNVLRALFTEKRWAGKNALVYAQTYLQYSSTSGRVVLALFRIKNTTGSTILWAPYFYYTAYSGWGELASVTVNGATNWASGGGPGTYTASVNLSIPPGRTSTVVFVAAGSYGAQVAGGIFQRTTALAFYNDSLALPPGLELVDDLDTAAGGWEL